MAKMGRPKKKKAQRKESLIQIRVNADDERLIACAAAAAKMDRSKWARQALLAAAQRVNIPEGEGIEPTAAKADEQV